MTQSRRRGKPPFMHSRSPQFSIFNYIRVAIQNGATRATVQNPARGDLFIARGRSRFILFFSGAAAERTVVLRKIWPAPASEPCRRTAPLKNKTGSLGTRRVINRSPLRGLRLAVGHL